MKPHMIRFAIFFLFATFAWPHQADKFTSKAGRLTITPIHHASLMLEGGGQVIHVDPSTAGKYEVLPKADLILITDVHGDHMDPKAIARLRKTGTRVLAPEAVAKTMTDVTIIRNGETKTVGGWKIEAVPMYNLKRGPAEGKLYHDKGRGNGYILTFGAKRFYIAGDTEAIPEMLALKNINVAFVPMNLPYTMTPGEAAAAVRAFSPKIVYPYHFGKSDVREFQKALAGTKIDVRLRNWY
jgi:L-ascorbate metabolism protein UlaG (beta-lactamase superfamily)